MPANIDWPTTPSVGDFYVYGARTWRCVNASPAVWQRVINNSQAVTTFVSLISTDTNLLLASISNAFTLLQS